MTNKFFEQKPEQLEEFLDFIEEDVENVRRVIDFIEENDLDVKFKVHPKAKTAQESAENTGFELGQIVKTLIFKAGDEFVAVLCPGDKRVSEDKLEEVTGEEVRMANPSEVREHTGYVVGGVSPFDLDINIYMEESLLERDELKPAAGSRVVGVTLDSKELKEAVRSKLADLA